MRGTGQFFLIATVLVCCYVSLIHGYNNGVGRTPPMGWTTWCTDTGMIPCYDDYCSEKEIMSVADAMASNGLRELGYNYVNLDDCWAGPRDASGNITADPKRFPSGMKALADYIHSKGLKLGLYTDAGPFTCRDNRPGSWGHYQQDANTYAAWGIDFVKMDWCDHPGGHSAPELYAMMQKALNNTGRPMFFSACEWGLYEPWTWGPNTTNSWRIGPDHLPLWWTPDTTQDPGQGQGTSNIIEHMAGLSKYASPGSWNDPDFLMTGFWWFTEAEQMTEFSFWCLTASPLIVATDVRYLDNKQVLLNKEAIAVNQDPWGIAGDRYGVQADGGEIWARPLSDGTWAVILYCPNYFEWTTITVVWSQHLPGWPKGKTSAKVRDLWAHQDLGTFTNSFTGDYIEPHSVMFLKVTPQ